MKTYSFYTIHTVVNIGDGVTSPLDSGKVTTTVNLCNLITKIMVYGYPMMASVKYEYVNLNDDINADFYNLPKAWGRCDVYTFKFALESNDVLVFDGIPLGIPTFVNGTRISKFLSQSDSMNLKNISVKCQSFAE